MERAAVEVRHLTTIVEIARAAAVIESIWGTASGVPTNLLRAVAHAGGYVVGAYGGTRMLGASVGFRGVVEGRAVLHSHITGVTDPGHGVGAVVKAHQRAWALAEGLEAITWTVDPLVARNGWFTIGKLGAVGLAYLPEHYGVMDDPINRGDATDRLLVWWPAEAAAPPAPPAAAPVRLLEVDELDRPALQGVEVDGAATAYAVRVPGDITALRSLTPNRAKEWRMAVRATMGQAMALGYHVTAVDRDGRYLLTRPTDSV